MVCSVVEKFELIYSSRDEDNFWFWIKKMKFFGGSNNRSLFNNWFNFSGVEIKGSWKNW